MEGEREREKQGNETASESERECTKMEVRSTLHSCVSITYDTHRIIKTKALHRNKE